VGFTPLRWEENVRVVTDLDELTHLVRAGKVEVVLALNLNGLGCFASGASA
jgi:hypothetical protein